MIHVTVFTQGYYFANSYLIYDESTMEGAIIDPTVPYTALQNDSFLQQVKVKYILLTHCHYDHLLYYEEWREKTKAKTAIGKKDNEGLLSGQINLSPLFIHKNQSYAEADILLQDGDTLPLGNIEINVLHTPGHTAGSVCYLADCHLFSGDTLFAEGDVGRTDFPTGDRRILCESIRRLMKLPSDIHVYPGHGPYTTVLAEQEYHKFN